MVWSQAAPSDRRLGTGAIYGPEGKEALWVIRDGSDFFRRKAIARLVPHYPLRK